MKRWLLTAVVALFVPLLVRGQAPDEKKLDKIVPGALKTFEAPGLAIVIVKGDQVVYRKGAGVRELGSPEAITEDTVFQIASCTKRLSEKGSDPLPNRVQTLQTEPKSRRFRGGLTPFRIAQGVPGYAACHLDRRRPDRLGRSGA